MTWPKTGGWDDGELFELPMLERITDANGYFSWPTAVAHPANGSPEDFLRRKRESIARGNSMGVTLTDLQMVAISWPTTAANDGARGISPHGYEKHQGGEQLQSAAANFPQQWQTVEASSCQGNGHRTDGRPKLGGQVRNFPEPWGTPSSRDVKGQYNDSALIRSDGKSRGELLPDQAVRFPGSHQPETTTPNGCAYSALIQLLCLLFGVQTESEFRAIPKSLNPKFAAWLMGWEPDWAFAPTSFVASETESSPSAPNQLSIN